MTSMRPLLLALSILAGCCIVASQVSAADSCKVCSDQQRACMKNYAGPTCKTEFQMCMKACKSAKK
jgi:hypothetical protein